MELDLGAVRAFLAVVDDGHFTDAADRLGMTQQAVSKRIARLESDLGAPLLNRSRAGARLTEDGAAFLPHARALISLADQAAGMVRARRRALRIDALARDAAPSDLVRSFYETSDVAVDLVVSRGAIAQQTALTDGSVDAAFGRVAAGLAPGIERVPACLEPLFVLVGRRHRLARRKRVPAQELSGLTAWMPGNAADSEWAEYYRFFSAEFGVTIDTSGPVFGRDHIIGEDRRLAGPDHVRRQDPAHRQPGRRPPARHRPGAGVPVVAAVARAEPAPGAAAADRPRAGPLPPLRPPDPVAAGPRPPALPAPVFTSLREPRSVRKIRNLTLVVSARPQAGERLDLGQPELARQHQGGRAAVGDHHGHLGHADRLRSGKSKIFRPNGPWLHPRRQPLLSGGRAAGRSARGRCRARRRWRRPRRRGPTRPARRSW